MSRTTMLPKEQIERKWRVIDAKDKVLGRIATKVAMVLMGKDKPEYTPHVDCGDFVIVVNCGEMKLTGLKLEKKAVYRHSGYPGGLHKKDYKDMMEKEPEKIMARAVRGMLPKNRLGRLMRKRLRVYRGAEHQQQAQKPEPVKI